MEERVAAPTTTYAWIPGHWEWNGRDWDCAPGKWVEPPYTEAVWVPSQWEWRGCLNAIAPSAIASLYRASTILKFCIISTFSFFNSFLLNS
ncbi:MAG: YXWGXW repeat-containing protein [Thermodesulfobacteriota bacterium]